MHRLGRRDRQLVGVLAEHLLDGVRFVLVVDGRRRAVGIEVVNVRRAKLCVLQRHPHGLARPFHVRVHHVLAVGGHAVPDQLGQNGRPALLCVLELLQDENARAFTQHGAIPLLGEREAAVGRQHVESLPGLHGTVVDDGLGGTSNGNVDHVVANVVARDADGVARRRAGATGGKRGPLDAVLDTDVRGGRRTDDAQQRQRVGGALVVNEKVAISGLVGRETACAGADDARRPIRVLERHFEPRLPYGLVSRRRREP